MNTFNHTSSKTFRVFLVTTLAVILSPFSHGADGNRKNPTSKLYIADLEGTSSINTGEKIEGLVKKAVYSAEGTVIETTEKSRTATVLSNGTGIALDPDTRLEVRRFMQEPFSPNRTDLDVEPSISQTGAFLSRGAIGLCTSKMVAGSTMTYSTRHGTISIQGRKAVIETTDDATIVSLIEGDVTIRGDLMSGGQSLKPGQQAVITRKSNVEPPVITIRPIPDADLERIGAKISSACMARKTVYFQDAERLNQNSSNGVFNPNDGSDTGTIIPVTVIPGAIPPHITISPYTPAP